MPLNEGATNQILPFCLDGTEAAGDLLSLEAYAAHVARLRGHQKGLALREVENRALRQALLMSAGVAQYIANRHAAGVLDNGDLDAIEEGLKSALAAQFPVATTTVPGVSRRATPKEITEKTVKDATVSPADLAGLDGLPVGAVLMVYGDDSEAPPGCLLMNGAAVTPTYPALRAFGLARGWQVNANGDPLLADMGGYVPRGYRSGQLVDSGRVFGVAQADALQNITGELSGILIMNTATKSGALSGSTWAAGNSSFGMGGVWTGGNVKFSAADGGARTADETRMTNQTFTFWIRAYPSSVTPGSIDLANLTNDLTDVEQRTTALESARSAETSVELTGLSQVLYTGIPAAANKLHIRLSNANVGTAVDVLLRLITAAGEVASGYVGGGAIIASTVSYGAHTITYVLSPPVVSARSGLVTLTRKPGTNIWTLSGGGGFSGGATWLSGGTADAGGLVTGLRLFSGSGGSFSAGSAGFWWEK